MSREMNKVEFAGAVRTRIVVSRNCLPRSWSSRGVLSSCRASNG